MGYIVIGIVSVGLLAAIGTMEQGGGVVLLLWVAGMALFLVSRLFGGSSTASPEGSTGRTNGGYGGGDGDDEQEPRDPGPRRDRLPKGSGGGGGELPVLEGEVVEEPRYIGIRERKLRQLETTKTHEEVFAPRLPAPKRKVNR